MVGRVLSLVSLSLLVAACGLSTRGLSSSRSAAERSTVGGWSRPVQLVPARTVTGSLEVAGTGGGSLAAVWVQGRFPIVSLEPLNASAPPKPVGRQEVMLAHGTFAAGFERPVQLAAGQSGSFTNLQVTASAPDIAYAVWEQSPGVTLRLSIMRAGHLVVSWVPLVHDAVPLALFPIVGGSAALIWDQYGHGDPFVQYAIVSSAGKLGAVVKIAHPGPRDTAATEVSVNESGELIAAWVHDDLAVVPGSSPSSPRYRTAQLMVAVCKPALRCASPQAVPVGDSKPACIEPAVAIGPDGTTTVVAAGCENFFGIRASVTHGSTTAVEPTRLIATYGAYPALVPVGNDGTLIAFNPGIVPYQSLAWSRLSANPNGRVAVRVLDHGGAFNSASQDQLAATDNGEYVIAWPHANTDVNPHPSLMAALGHNDQLGRPSVVAPASVGPNQYVAAIDQRGDAIIMFNAFGANHGGGVFATIHPG
jgi:hypothetical protein